jgi:hypothetical protein
MHLDKPAVADNTDKKQLQMPRPYQLGPSHDMAFVCV